MVLMHVSTGELVLFFGADNGTSKRTGGDMMRHRGAFTNEHLVADDESFDGAWF